MSQPPTSPTSPPDPGGDDGEPTQPQPAGPATSGEDDLVVRHFEPALRRPDQTPTGSYDWLFRTEEPGSAVGAADASTVSGDHHPAVAGMPGDGPAASSAADVVPHPGDPTSAATTRRDGAAGVAAAGTVGSAAAVAGAGGSVTGEPGRYAADPASAGAGAHSGGVPPTSAPATPAATPRRRRRHVVLAVALGTALLVTLIGLVVLIGQLRDRTTTAAPTSVVPSATDPASAQPSQSRPTPTPSASASGSPSASPSPTPNASAVPTGPVVPTGISVDCQADPATDDSGEPVRYDPANLVDGDPATAWRCNGDGRGKTLTLTLPDDSTVRRVGLVNGYTKTDPTSGKHRYGEYRRITSVRWTFADGTVVEQNLADGNETLQSIDIAPEVGNRVVLTVLASTEPGGRASSRDAVLISEIALG